MIETVEIDIRMINWLAEIERMQKEESGYSIDELIEILKGNFILTDGVSK